MAGQMVIGFVGRVIAVMALVAVAPAGHGDAARWEYERFTDPFERNGSVHIASIETVDARMIVRCASPSGLPEIRIFLPRDRIDALTTVAWSFDRRREQSAPWRVSANRRSIVLPVRFSDDFIYQLRVRSALTVTVVSGQEAMPPVQFPLTGSSVAIFKALNACGR
ncbi:MAG: hypothetical protein RIC56_02790 [Pseudomonadales bacterium]